MSIIIVGVGEDLLALKVLNGESQALESEDCKAASGIVQYVGPKCPNGLDQLNKDALAENMGQLAKWMMSKGISPPKREQSREL